MYIYCYCLLLNCFKCYLFIIFFFRCVSTHFCMSFIIVVLVTSSRLLWIVISLDDTCLLLVTTFHLMCPPEGCRVSEIRRKACTTLRVSLWIVLCEATWRRPTNKGSVQVLGSEQQCVLFKIPAPLAPPSGRTWQSGDENEIFFSLVISSSAVIRISPKFPVISASPLPARRSPASLKD